MEGATSGKRAAASDEQELEKRLWGLADRMRGHMDPSEYKHVVLGLIFLKYISDAFEEQRHKLEGEEGTDPEDRDEYLAYNVFWVPAEARWPHLQANAKQPTIGTLIDDAMWAIEKDNPTLKGVLPRDYGRPSLDKTQLGGLIDLVCRIGLSRHTQQVIASGQRINAPPETRVVLSMGCARYFSLWQGRTGE